MCSARCLYPTRDNSGVVVLAADSRDAVGYCIHFGHGRCLDFHVCGLPATELLAVEQLTDCIPWRVGRIFQLLVRTAAVVTIGTVRASWLAIKFAPTSFIVTRPGPSRTVGAPGRAAGLLLVLLGLRGLARRVQGIDLVGVVG